MVVIVNKYFKIAKSIEVVIPLNFLKNFMKTEESFNFRLMILMNFIKTEESFNFRLMISMNSIKIE